VLSDLELPQRAFSRVCNKHNTNSSVFTALRGIQTRSSDENSVCLSVCMSVERVNYDKTEEKFVQIFIPYEISSSLVFPEEEWLVGATPTT